MDDRDAPPTRFTLPARFHYVLIIEWLNSEDERTGEKLLDVLDTCDCPALLARCRTADDVRQALIDARRRAPHQIPAIHLEAHGAPLPETADVEPEFGNGAGDSMYWRELGDLLAPLNEASDFRLMLVSGACYGQAAIAAMNVGRHVAPFAVCIGFTTSVAAASVRESMMELYSDLFRRNKDFDTAIESARRELFNVGERLEADTALKLAYQMIRQVLAELRETSEKAGLSDEALEKVMAQRLRSSLEIWNYWFPLSLQERDPIYRPNLQLLMG